MAERAGKAFSRALRSTPVRLALALVAVFAVVHLVTLGLAYLSLRAELVDRMQADLRQHLAGFDVVVSPRAAEILVAAEAAAADPARRVFAYIAPDGRVTGNAQARLARGSVEISAQPEGRPLSPDGYLPLVQPLAGGILVIAESRTPLADLRRTFLWLLALSLAPSAALSLGAGVWLARREERRVARIESVLDALTRGELNARLPVSADDRQTADDLTRIAAQINRMAEAQQSATEALRQVSADIAHDLRTPLQRLSVTLQELAAQLPEDAPAHDLARRAQDEADSAIAMFRALLQIAQIEGGNARDAFEPVDLVALCRELAELYAPSAEDGGHVLTTALPERAVVVHAHRTLISQALANLIENALRHTPEGTPIEIALKPGRGEVAMIVADRGPGIPEPERAKVTRRLYRLERSRATPGNGLGLALVDAIARAHGGRLVLEDNRPGLRARLVLPVAPAQGV